MSSPSLSTASESSLVRSRHTYERFVWRYAENDGTASDNDLIQSHVYVPATPSPEPSMVRDPRMMKLDPDTWKQQDHYMVMGLEEKRQAATAEDIRQAYRARVLLYHPDKIAQRNGEGKSKRQKDDAIFKCIQKAHQILTDADKRASFDAVDPTFDNSIPGEKLPSGACFYATYGPVFERNMRFSKTKSDVKLGGPDSTRDDVETFYHFWSNFDSTRRFDYWDEDENEAAENRADKRYMEKKNKAARLKRKNEDNARLRTLFEQAYKIDPRIKAWKEADKAAKAAKANKRNEKANSSSVKSATLAEQKVKDEAAKKAEEEAKAIAAEAAKEAKKVKEAEATALKKEKKAFRAIFNEHNYFMHDLSDLKAFETEAILVESICSKLSRLEIGELRSKVEAKVAANKGGEVSNLLRERLGVDLVAEKKPVEQAKAASMASAASCESAIHTFTSAPWTLKETDLLINGTKKFPGGTVDRWETVADWFNRQVDAPRTVDEIISKANEIKGSGSGMSPLEAEGWNASSKRDPRIDQSEPTLASSVLPEGPVSLPWSVEEQAALEQALKNTPADDSERWEKIAVSIGSRTKKECMIRAKEIALALKAKQ